MGEGEDECVMEKKTQEIQFRDKREPYPLNFSGRIAKAADYCGGKGRVGAMIR